MKELTTIIFVLLVAAAGVTGYSGVKNAVQFHYMCGVDVPWYAAVFLDVNKCPSYGGAKLNSDAAP